MKEWRKQGRLDTHVYCRETEKVLEENLGGPDLFEHLCLFLRKFSKNERRKKPFHIRSVTFRI